MLTRRLLLLAVSLALGLAACGGGSSGGGDSGGGEPLAGTLSVEQRSLATGRVAAQFQQITGGRETATVQEWEQLRAWVMTQPEFMDAGVGDQLLWARFSDGRYFLYTDNWRPLPEGQLSMARGLSPLQKSALLKQEVPASADALLLGDPHEDFEASGPVMDRMAIALHTRGWTPSPERTFTVEALKSAGELGFLYLTAHGGSFGRTGDKHHAMTTDTRVGIINDEKYASELDDTSLIYHRDRRGWERVGINQGLRYAVTARFIDRHMRFSAGSLVILVSCESGSAAASGFRDAFRLRGAGTIIGWDGPANPHSFPTMDLLVDRLTGMNSVEAVTPGNRAFAFDDVWSYLERKKLLETRSVDVGGRPTPVRRFFTGFTMLQPVVAELEATGIDKLLLHGEFGKQPAVVSVGGKEFPALPSADGKLLEVQIGPDAHGEVIVTSRKRKSNPRVLASWRGQVSYVQTFEGGCGAVFSNSMMIDLHLRADAHAVRDEVDGPLRNSRRLVMPASDTKARWAANGLCQDSSGVTERWSGAGELPLTLYDPRTFAPTSAEINLVQARIDAVQGRFQFVALTGTARVKTVEESGDSSKEPLVFLANLHGFFNDGSDAENLMPIGTFIPFGSRLAVPAGQHRKAQPDTPAEALTIEWTPMPVSPTYDDSIGR